MIRLFGAGSIVNDWLDHLRNDITGAVDHHAVALTNVFSLNILLVVQRCLSYSDATNLNRLQDGIRVEGACFDRRLPGSPPSE